MGEGCGATKEGRMQQRSKEGQGKDIRQADLKGHRGRHKRTGGMQRWDVEGSAGLRAPGALGAEPRPPWGRGAPHWRPSPAPLP